MNTDHNLLFQEANLADDAEESERSEFLRKVPSHGKIDRFLKGREKSNPSPRFAEFFDLQIAVFVAAVPAPAGTRVVVAGVTNITQKQYDQLAAVIGRGTARWNRSEFKDAVEAILGIDIQDYAGRATG
jgi:hypothetical protein